MCVGGFRGSANDGTADPAMEDEWVGEKKRTTELFDVRFWVLPSGISTMQHSVTVLISCPSKGSESLTHAHAAFWHCVTLLLSYSLF